MLEGRNILSFSMNYWDGMWMSRQQIISRLSKKNKVLYVSQPFHLHDILRDIGKAKLHASGTIKINENLYTHVPSKLIPYTFRSEMINRFFSHLRRKIILLLMKKLEMKDVILLIWHPDFLEEVGKYKEKQVVYYIHDNYSGYGNAYHAKKIISKEEVLLKKTDVVIVNGDMLYKKFKDSHQHVINSPSAVDFDLFQNAVKSPKTCIDLEHVPVPRIGYVGMINTKVDFEMLLYIAVRHPEWSIVLVGPERISEEEDVILVNKLKSLHNVFFLGFKDVKDLPDYVNAMDVCLMCYRIKKWTPYIFPLKLYEYLACGKPVIGSPLKNLLKFHNVIHIAKSHEEWEEKIYASLTEKDNSFYEERVQIARENTWEIRVKKISDAMECNLNS